MRMSQKLPFFQGHFISTCDHFEERERKRIYLTMSHACKQAFSSILGIQNLLKRKILLSVTQAAGMTSQGHHDTAPTDTDTFTKMNDNF